MRKIVFLLLLISTLSSKAQSMLNESMRWNVFESIYYPCWCKSQGTHHYYLKGDTIIENKKYKILYDSLYFKMIYDENSPDYHYDWVDVFVEEVGYLREDTIQEKVYFLEGNYNDEDQLCYTEFTIYDFNISIDSSLYLKEALFSEGYYWENGFATTSQKTLDSLNLIYSSKYNYYDNYIVTSIDSIEYFNKKRKVITLTFSGSSGLNYNRNIKWISGIGSDNGFIYFRHVTNDYPGSILLCAHDNNEMLYLNDLGYDCFATYVSLEEPKIKKLIIAPNPAIDRLTISGDDKIGIITVYDNLGNVIIQTTSQEKETTLDILKLSKGVYQLKVNDEIHSFIKE